MALLLLLLLIVCSSVFVFVLFSLLGSVMAGAPPSPLLAVAVPNVTAHPSTASVPNSYYLMWHYNCLWTLKG